MFIVFGLIAIILMIILMMNYLLKGNSFKNSKLGITVFVSLCVSTILFIVTHPLVNQ